MSDDNNQNDSLITQVYLKLSQEAEDLEKGKLKLRQLMSEVVDKQKMDKIIQHINNIND